VRILAGRLELRLPWPWQGRIPHKEGGEGGKCSLITERHVSPEEKRRTVSTGSLTAKKRGKKKKEREGEQVEKKGERKEDAEGRGSGRCENRRIGRPHYTLIQRESKKEKKGEKTAPWQWGGKVSGRFKKV